MVYRSVLIIEDDSDIREILREVCVLEGYRVLTARSGRDAMRILDEMPSEPCLILLDLMMPSIREFNLLETHCGRNKFVQIPVVGMTTRMDAHVPDQATGLISKPVDLDDLLKLIQTHCQQASA